MNTEANPDFDVISHWRERAAHFRLNKIPGADFCDSRAHELEAAKKRREADLIKQADFHGHANSKAIRESTATPEEVAALKARISELEASVAKKRNGK